MTSIEVAVERLDRRPRDTLVDRLLRRVRVLVRHRRRLIARRRALRLLRAEMRDQRWLDDIGVKGQQVCDAQVAGLARAMGGR